MSTVCDNSSLVNTSLGLRNTGVCLQEHCVFSHEPIKTLRLPLPLPYRPQWLRWWSAGETALHSGTAQSNASLSSLRTPTNLTVATTEVSAAACYYVRGGGEEKESATDKTSCSRARAVCQSIGMLSLYLVAAARASARVSGCSCLCHLPIWFITIQYTTYLNVFLIHTVPFYCITPTMRTRCMRS